MPNQVIKKVKLPDNTVVDIHDSRITGVDFTPTSSSTNVVQSGGVYNRLNEKTDKIQIDPRQDQYISRDVYDTLENMTSYGTNWPKGLNVFIVDDRDYLAGETKMFQVSAVYFKYNSQYGDQLVLYAKWKYEEEIFVYIDCDPISGDVHEYRIHRKPLMPEPQKDLKVIIGKCMPEYPQPGSVYFFGDREYKFKFRTGSMDGQQISYYIWQLIAYKVVPLLRQDIANTPISIRVLFGHRSQEGQTMGNYGLSFDWSSSEEGYYLQNWVQNSRYIVDNIADYFMNYWDFDRHVCIVYFQISGEWAKCHRDPNTSFRPNAFRILRDRSWYPMIVKNAKTTTPNVEIFSNQQGIQIMCNRTINMKKQQDSSYHTLYGYNAYFVVYYWRTKPKGRGKMMKRWVRYSEKYFEEGVQKHRDDSPVLLNKNGTTYLRWQCTNEPGKTKSRPCKAYLLVKNHYRSSVPIQ